MMKILRVKKSMFDVFIGEGWLGWTRLLLDKKTKKLIQLAGNKLPQHQMLLVEQALKK